MCSSPTTPFYLRLVKKSTTTQNHPTSHELKEDLPKKGKATGESPEEDDDEEEEEVEEEEEEEDEEDDDEKALVEGGSSSQVRKKNIVCVKSLFCLTL